MARRRAPRSRSPGCSARSRARVLVARAHGRDILARARATRARRTWRGSSAGGPARSCCSLDFAKGAIAAGVGLAVGGRAGACVARRRGGGRPHVPALPQGRQGRGGGGRRARRAVPVDRRRARRGVVRRRAACCTRRRSRRCSRRFCSRSRSPCSATTRGRSSWSRRSRCWSSCVTSVTFDGCCGARRSISARLRTRLNVDRASARQKERRCHECARR